MTVRFFWQYWSTLREIRSTMHTSVDPVLRNAEDQIRFYNYESRFVVAVRLVPGKPGNTVNTNLSFALLIPKFCQKLVYHYPFLPNLSSLFIVNLSHAVSMA